MLHWPRWFANSKTESVIIFGYDNWSPQGGMNDQGLFFDYFSVKKLDINQSKEKPIFPGPQTDTMMATCATVEDVVKLYSRYYFKWNPKIQMFVVDKTGDSAIFEGETVVRNRDAYQVVTNFRLSKIPDSNIYDLKNQLVYVYYFHDFDDEIVINLREELKNGRHYFDLPLLFGKELKHDNKLYVHSSPDFSISYPKHYKVVKSTMGAVLLAKNPLSSTPRIGVYVENKLNDIELTDLGQEYFYSKLEKHSTNVKLISSKQTLLNDGTPGVEMLFDNVVNEYWPLQTLILSTYRGDRLVFAAITSVAHPEALKDYIYSLRFD